MTASVVTNTCRLTVISPTQRVDLAVPMQTSVAELLTLVVSGLGPDMADKGAAEGGWVLQRAGEAPLDPGSNLAASNLHDGDTLQLRTRATRLPELAFDDVLDAVADGVLQRTSRWKPVHTQRACAAMAAALLVFAIVTMLLSGPSWVAGSVAAGVGAVLLVLAATALSRVYRRRGPAIAASGFALALAFASGATAVGGTHRVWDFGAPQMLVGVCATTLFATVLLIVLAAGVAGFVAVITTSVLVAIGTGIATGTTLSASGTAAIVATAALIISPLLPTLSFRLSRMPLPTIPFDAADLRRDTSTIDTEQVLGRAVRADEFLTGLSSGVALALAGAAVIISGDGGVCQRILAIVIGFVCLLRGRLFTGRAQRGVLLVAGSLALIAVLVAGAVQLHGLHRTLAFVIPAVVIALVLFAFSVVLPDRRYTPPVSRMADILESLLVLSVIPLALAVMGVYGAIRTAT